MTPRLVVEELRVADIVGPLDLAVAAGECVGLSGPSGAGKTLLLRAIADLIPHVGACRLDGEIADQFAPPDWRRRVAYLPAESAWWHDTVGPHLPAVDGNALAALGFDRDVLDWPVARLSAGERQRLALLRSLALQPPVLLLDEPTAHLDAGNGDRIENLIAAVRRRDRTAVVWVAHDQQQLARVADRRVRLAPGGQLQCS